MSSTPRLLGYVAFALSLVAIGLHFIPRHTASKLSFKTPEDAIKSFATGHYEESPENYLQLIRANHFEEKWPMVDPKTLTIAKIVPVEDSGFAENNGQMMCFISCKTMEGVLLHQVVALQKNFEGNFGISILSDTEYLPNPSEGDKKRALAKQAWESSGVLK